ncbi:MAG: hypothetical protein AAFY15_12830, partial [Cyanobacteria bacterium J06648_11]
MSSNPGSRPQKYAGNSDDVEGGASSSEALAIAIDRETGVTYEAIVSLASGRLLSWQPILDVRASDPHRYLLLHLQERVQTITRRAG